MKILFWLLAILSIPVGGFMSVVGYLSNGLGLYHTVIGKAICIFGMFSLVVSIACAVLGIIRLRRGDVKKAVAFALAGVAYSGVIFAGILIEEAVDTMMMEKAIENRKEEMYGENWNSPPAIEGIPEGYHELMNEFYASIKGGLTDNLMNFGAVSMTDYYGDAPLDNIGFRVMDVNGDGVDEVVIGTTAPGAEGGTVIFCIYGTPENPNFSVGSVEGDIYYLHAGETDGTYLAEIGGRDGAWQLLAVEGESFVEINYREGAMDPAGRMTLEMIPFSRYK